MATDTESTDAGEERDDAFLSMSDEEFLALDPNALEEPQELPTEEESEGEASEPEDDATPSGESEEPAGEADEPETDEEPATDDKADSADDAGDDAGDPDGDASDDTDGDDDSDDADKPDDSKSPDYEAFYKRLTGTFKANGKDMRVENPEDAIRLMQMGANYNRKMAALKPNLKILKTLEKHKLLDEQKLGFLIDLDKKNPAAIARLLKDSAIDPMDLDLDQEKQYKASTYTVDDKEVDLDTVIDDIRDTDTYTKTLDLVGTKWDANSKQVVADTPQLLKVINDHMASGVYDVISTEVERERMLGRLAGQSDIEAYRNTGDAIQARGGFDHLFPSPEQGQQKPPAAPAPAPKSNEKAQQRSSRRRAASPSKPAAPTSASKDYNPLGMSDDEFEKQFDSRLL